MTGPVPRLNGFGLGLFLVALAAWCGDGAFAEIRASGKNGLGTKVNGRRGGLCTTGVCRIGGGTNAGKNKFHRFKNFDTRGAIKRVEFDTGGQRNLVVGVTSAKGSWIDKAMAFSSKANLYFLSPGGIHLGKGAGFINVPKLSLSTADQLHFSDGVFDVFRSKPNKLRDFSTNPLPGVFGMRRSELEEPVVLKAGQLPGIHLDGINISLDEELLVDAPGGRVDVSGSRLDVGTEEVGGRIALTGEAINVDGESELSTSGSTGGGLIQVGGSWQNSDASVRQATTSTIESGALLDASAGERGDGGEIVVWSDITNPESRTIVSGDLRARGGVDQGNGGRIETSGLMLNISGIQIDAKAERGVNGLWLLDPRDIIITSGIQYTSGLSGTKYSGYFNDNLSFFDTASTESDSRFDSPFTSINRTTPGNNFDDTYSARFIGYFKAPSSGQFTFKTTSDDASYLWLGSDNTQSVESFESSITTGNALVNNGGLHPAQTRTGTTTFSLSQDSYYPLIVYFGENFGADNITVSYSAPGLNSTDNGSGVYFSRTGAEGLDINAANATDSNTDASITSSTIQTALAEANVSLVASRDIKVQSPISLEDNANTLTLDAGNTIVIDQSITGVGALNLLSEDGVAVNADVNAGSIDISATVTGGLSGSGNISVSSSDLKVPADIVVAPV